MATSVATGDILSARAWTTLNDQAAVNTFNYECITFSGGAVTDQDFCNAVDVFWSGFYKGVMSPASSFDGTQVYFLKRSGPLPAPVKEIASAGPGTLGTAPVPPNAAAIMKYNATARGPGGRGRVYLPFFSTLLMGTDGRLTVAGDTAINNLAASLLPAFSVTSGGSSATFQWGLVRRFPRPTPPVINQIIQASSANAFGQMHKRGSYGRQNLSPL